MTSTMRWLILLPAGPGALVGGWLGDYMSREKLETLRREQADAENTAMLDATAC